MSYWKTKVVPKFKKFFDHKGKKKAASEACKSFDSSKESIEKEIEEKRSDLHPKVIEIYRSSTVITKKLLKEPDEPAVKENPDASQSVLQELAKAGFPQAQFLFDAGGKSGPALLPGPIVYLFQKTSTFLVEEPLPETTRELVIEGGQPPKAEETKEPEAVSESIVETTPPPPPPAVEEKGESSEEKKEVVAAEDKKEEVATVEVKKEEMAPLEAKKEVVAPAEVKTEVAPIEAKQEVVAPPVIVEKKEEAAPPVKEEKKEVAPMKEEKKEEAVATPSEAKKEDAPKTEKKDEEKPTAIPTSVGEKK